MLVSGLKSTQPIRGPETTLSRWMKEDASLDMGCFCHTACGEKFKLGLENKNQIGAICMTIVQRTNKSEGGTYPNTIKANVPKLCMMRLVK